MSQLENYLNQIKNQEITEESKILVAENPVLDALCKKYEVWLKKFDPFSDKPLIFLDGLEYTSKDVKDFSIMLKKYEDHDRFSESGQFLSFLTNHSYEKTFEIITMHLNKTINWVGAFCGKKIIVTGDLGECTGYCMKEGGELHVSGKIKQLYSTCQGKVFQNGQQMNWPQWGI